LLQNLGVSRRASSAAVQLIALATAVVAMFPDLHGLTTRSPVGHHVTIASQAASDHDRMHPQRMPERRDETVISAAVPTDHARTDSPLALVTVRDGRQITLPNTTQHTFLLERPLDRPHRRTLVLLI
jgi:hypothetical protein